METSTAARGLSSRFVAGTTLEEALAVCRRINQEGLSVTLDYLGENVTSLDEAANSREMYLRMLHALADQKIDGNVSLKLSQFGMDLSEQACRENVRKLVCVAAELRNFVRIDMESSEYTEATLAIVRDLHALTHSCGAVIQAYLHRSESDVADLCSRRIRVRLCKGAYLEPPSVAIQSKQDVDANFVKLAQALLTNGYYPAIATHDENMVAAVQRLAAERKLPRDAFEFQMLYGIRRDLQKALVADGYRVRLYVPFGEAWYPYFMRRLAERPANALFIARNLFRE
ncbi:MAG: proline dehydrogenase [Steroidobacteraceae bacterium]